MFNKDVSTPTEFPVEESKRWSTDVCCTTLTAIFALTIFILACVFFNTNGLNAAYFTPEIMNQRPGYESFKSALFWGGLLALSIGLLSLTLIQFTPKHAPLIFIGLAGVTLIVIGVLAIVKPSAYLFNNRGVKILLLVVVFGLTAIVITMGLMYRNAIRLQGIFLDYSRRFLVEKVSTFIYIPIFMIFTFGLFVLFLFQHEAFSSKSHSNSNFYDFSNPGFLGWLNIIEFIWGLQFLRDAFNFCVSGVAIDWYWGKTGSHWYTPMRRLIVKNWGSVVAGSFLNAFLQLPTLIVELFTCHKNTCCGWVGSYCDNHCFIFDYVFNLVRTDVYSYINLSGIPYCNSARECTKICHFNDQFVGNYNPIKHFRFVAMVFAVSISTLFSYIFTEFRLSDATFWHIFFIIVVVYSVVCWFINICADGAESISTSFFVEHFQSNDYQFMQKAIPSFRKQIEHRSKKIHQDGTF